MNTFQNLKNNNVIADSYAEVLFSLYGDVQKEWTKEYHAIATLKNHQSERRYIRFTNDYNPETRSSSLQVQSSANTDLFPKNTLIFASCQNYANKKQEVENSAIMFFYGLPDEYTLIKKYDTFFTTQEFNGAVSEDEIQHQYSDGGPMGFQIYKTGYKRTAAENFKKYSLVGLMKHSAFKAGRILGQHSKTPKKQAAARANGKKVAIRYKAEIEFADGFKVVEFDSGVECFKYFSGVNGHDKVFNNLMAFSRAMAKAKGEYHYSTGKMSIVIYSLVVKPSSKNNILTDNKKEDINIDNIFLTSGDNIPQPSANDNNTITAQPQEVKPQKIKEDRLKKKWEEHCKMLDYTPDRIWTFEEFKNIGEK
jgi:hypothetical protein